MSVHGPQKEVEAAHVARAGGELRSACTTSPWICNRSFDPTDNLDSTFHVFLIFDLNLCKEIIAANK